MNHDGILRDEGILPGRPHGVMILTHRIPSRLRRFLPVRVVTIVATLCLIVMPFVVYGGPNVIDEFSIARKVTQVRLRIYINHAP